MLAIATGCGWCCRHTAHALVWYAGGTQVLEEGQAVPRSASQHFQDK
jgi:hypothetical protein